MDTHTHTHTHTHWESHYYTHTRRDMNIRGGSKWQPTPRTWNITLWYAGLQYPPLLHAFFFPFHPVMLSSGVLVMKTNWELHLDPQLPSRPLLKVEHPTLLPHQSVFTGRWEYRCICEESCVRALTHQTNIEELAVRRADSCVASGRLCLARKLHLNAPRRWKLMDN